MEDVLYQHGAAWYEASWQSSKRNATKKNTTCLKLMRLVSDTVVLLSCSDFFRVTTNPFVCQLPWNPVLPLNPYVHPSGTPIKIPFFVFITKEPSEPPGCVKNGRLWNGYSSGRCWGDAVFQSFSNSRWFRRMLWNDPIYTVWQEKWPARPSTKKISCKHKSQAKKKIGSGCSGLDAEI